MYASTILPKIIDSANQIPGEVISQDDKNAIIEAFYFIIGKLPFLPVYGIIVLTGSFFQEITNRRSFLQRVLITQQQDEIIKEKSFSEKLQQDLLENILPPSIVAKLQEHKVFTRDTLRTLSQKYEGVSMLYADLVGFTAFSSQVDSSRVMVFLNGLFQVFDDLCDRYHVYKVETIGDCYVAATGLDTDSDGEPTEHQPCADVGLRKNKARMNAQDMLGFAQAMLRGSHGMLMPGLDVPARLRVGVHTGTCISGVVGTKSLRFCLLGEAVDVAAAMEQGGVPGCIHASEAVVDLAPGYAWERREAAFDHPATGPMATYILKL